MEWPILIVFVLGACVASLLNAAVYAWAWNYRRISPWQATPEGAAPRTWADCVPIIGWFRLRRDAKVLGRGFWIRPMLVEISFGIAMAALYGWEVGQQGLTAAQFNLPAGVNLPAGGLPELVTPAFCTFVFHFILSAWMLIASLIDVDEKTIPDEVTVPGALIGLLLAALLPFGFLPNIEERLTPPVIGIELTHPKSGAPLPGAFGGTQWIEPTHLTAPNDWPAALAGGAANRGSLALGLGCYLFWCFALTTRIWRGRRGVGFGLAVLFRRVARDLQSSPLREILIGGVLGIAMVWYTGGDAWVGLLSSLTGMILGGGIVWAVRLIGSAALGKEAMGFGDVTLMMMVGAFLGWQASLMIFFLAPFAGLLVGIFQLIFRRDDMIPYGPFLCLAACFVVVRWGTLWPKAEAIFSLGTVLPIVLIVCLALLGILLALWRIIKVRLLGISED